MHTMPGSSMAASTATWATWASLLAVPVVAALTLLFKRYGSSLLAVMVEASNFAVDVVLLVTQPSTPRKRAMINALGALTWATRTTSATYKAFISSSQHHLLVPLFQKGQVYVMIIFTMVVHMAATQHMVPWLRLTLAFLYACVMGRLAVCVTAAAAAPAGLPWWHQLALYLLVQLCVFGPYTLLTHVCAWQAKRAAATSARLPASSSRDSKAEADGVHDDSTPMRGTDHSKHTPGSGNGQPETSSTEPLQPLASPHPHIIDRGPAASHNTSQQLAQQPAAPHASRTALVQALQCAPYTSKLGPKHKVCLKLDTHTSCDALPPDLAGHIQHALSSVMGPSSLRVTELAVRSGCVMLTMTICRTQSHAHEHIGGAHAPAGPEDLSASEADEQLAATIGQALLQRICRPAAPGTSGHAADGSKVDAPGLIACQRALLQVDAQLMAATWQEEAWDLRALVTVPARRDSCDSAGSTCASESAAGTAVAPWLGVVTACEQLPPAAVPDSLLSSCSTSCCDEGSGDPKVSFGVQLQLWGLGKLDVVEGWQPPPEGAHTWPAHGHGRQGNAASSSGRGLRLLARSLGGGYLVTSVAHVARSYMAGGGATVQAVVSLRESELVRHHAAGLPSQLLLLVLELWEGEVLLSSTPLLAANAAGTAADSCSLQAWWWGAADPAVAAALADLQLCAQALEERGEAAADVLPSHLAFMADLSVWLAGVRRCALSSQQLCAMAKHTCLHGQHTAAGLPPAELQQLGEDLLAHARRSELRGVQAMVRQQMQHTVLPAVQQQQQQQRGQWRAWLQGLRNVALGYHCQQCEAAYKQHLALRLSRVQAASSGGTALYVLAATCSAVSKGDHLVRTVASSGPWGLLHATGAGLRAAVPSAPPQSTLPWSAAAYCWRVTARLMMWLGLMPKLRFSSWFCRSVRTWLLTFVVLAATEQMQASAVLPARWILAVSALVEVPAVCICAWRHATPKVLLLTLVLAPTAIVGVRLAIDARLRRAWVSCAAGCGSMQAGSSCKDAVACMAAAALAPPNLHDKLD